MKIKFLYLLFLIIDSYTSTMHPPLPGRTEGESPEPTETTEPKIRIPLRERKRRLINIEHITDELQKLILEHNETNLKEKHLLQSQSKSPYVWIFNNMMPDLEFKLSIQYIPGIPDLITIQLYLINPETFQESEYIYTCEPYDLKESMQDFLDIIAQL